MTSKTSTAANTPFAAPTLRKPYLLFLGDIDNAPHAKTAFGLRDWIPDDCLAQWRLPACKVDLELPEMAPGQAAQAGAKSLVIGVAVSGGRIPDHWLPCLLEAIEAGLDIVSGQHVLLDTLPQLVAAAKANGTTLIDVRIPPPDLPVGTGIKRSGKRLLTVGSDCALGKKYTALTLARTMRVYGIEADFRATGQTGILIAGSGIPIDAVVADFISGAAECLSPAAADTHWDVIEGQGAIVHPSFAAVTLGLLHGSQPDALILCHDPTRQHIRNRPYAPIPPLDQLARRYLEAASVTNARARLAGVSLNTSALDTPAAQQALDAVEQLLGVPAFDPLRTSAERVVESILA